MEDKTTSSTEICCGESHGSSSSPVPPKSCLRSPSSKKNKQCSKQAEDDIDSGEIHPHAGAEKRTSSSSIRSSIPRNVSFNKIEIAEHPYELGDNPSVQSGVPITIAWKPQERIILDVDEYEDLRSSNRSREEMRLPSAVREQLAKESGASRSEVVQAIQQARHIADSRRKSVQTQHWDKINYQLEKTQRTIRKVTSLDGLKKKVTSLDGLKTSLGKKNRPSRLSFTNELDSSRHNASWSSNPQQNATWNAEPPQLRKFASLTLSTDPSPNLETLIVKSTIKTEPAKKSLGIYEQPFCF